MSTTEEVPKSSITETAPATEKPNTDDSRTTEKRSSTSEKATGSVHEKDTTTAETTTTSTEEGKPSELTKPAESTEIPAETKPTETSEKPTETQKPTEETQEAKATGTATAVSSALDEKVEFKGWGVNKPGLELEPVSYHPKKLGPEDIEIQITHCGICYSDLHTISGGWNSQLPYTPLIPGHEVVGKVSQVGSKAKFKVGQIVGYGPLAYSCLNRDKTAPKCKFCSIKKDNLCDSRVFTYSGFLPDGTFAEGGYAEKIRVDSNFAFPIPKDIESKYAAPLMCAGLTVYAPLARFKINKKHKVGIIGLGGLGHLGIQISNKMGAQTYAIGHSKQKIEEAKKLGAIDYIDTNNEEEMKNMKYKFDYILCTANAKGLDWRALLSLVAKEGKFCLLAIPEDELHFKAGDVINNHLELIGSIIGSRSETIDMLKFCSKYKIRPVIEEFPMEQVNVAVQKVSQNKVRYRAVLVNNPTATQPAATITEEAKK